MKLILDNSSKVQELELQVEKERRTFHESKLEISNLEEKLQNCKHENVLLNSKVEEMSFNEIETQEKIKKLQESYEGQVESLSASQQEIKSKWKDKWRTVSRELDIATEQLKDLENTTEQQETELDSLRSHNEVLSGKVIDHESTLVEKNNLIKQQKHMIWNLAEEKEELALDLEKQTKLIGVEMNNKNTKIEHLQHMIEKYKKVVEKVDVNLKQLPQEFGIKLMSVEKKLKREKEAKNKAVEEIKKLKRDLLEKETQVKRQAAIVKNSELKAFTEWDMNNYSSTHNHLKKSLNN